MKTLIITSEAELQAAKNKDSDIIFDGHIEFKLNILLSFGVRNISSGGDISSGRCYIEVQCMLGIKFTGELICKAVVPMVCAGWDREFWAERFGIDTTDGCWDDFVKRLAIVAPKLLKKKHWLPIERLMIESSTGKYSEVEQ